MDNNKNSKIQKFNDSMKKGKERENKMWKSFLINVLGVIVGIMLTFGGNALWQKREEKKKIREMLILVRSELTSCKAWFKVQEETIKSESYVYKKIFEAKDDWTIIPIDTLHGYRSIMVSTTYSELTTSSWQIFQNSEIIQKMSDKELVIRLARCYSWIEKIQEVILKKYWDGKERAKVFERDPYKFFDAVMLNKESFYFYETMGSDTNPFEDGFFFINTYIDYTILLLDKNGNFLYDMDDRNNELKLFFKARSDSLNLVKDSLQIKNENK